MIAASDPNMIIAGFAVGGLVFAVFWRFIVWIRDAPVKPDPWDAEVEQQLSEPEAVEVCPHCFTEQPPDAWFCAHCGSAVGPYNNMMPCLNVFSEGEVLRNGAAGRLRTNPLIIAGYLLFSLSTYVVFAPVFWFFLFKNLQRSREEKPGAQPDGVPS